MSGVATQQFISFTVAGAEYGVDIMDVREIKGWSPVRALPGSHSYVRGVIDLRGTIVPIIDVRTRFQIGTTEATPAHVILIVAVDELMFGLLADTVVDIITTAVDDIKPVPVVKSRDDTAFLLGVIPVDGRMVVLLDLPRILGGR